MKRKEFSAKSCHLKLIAITCVFEKYIDWMRNLKIDTHGDLDIKPTSDKANVPKFSVNVADLYL